MNIELQLKLQAYIDGELSDAETCELLGRLDGDEQASALLTELKNTRAAIRAGEPEQRLPESRDFYWSKIRREIEREEMLSSRVEHVPWLQRFVRYLLPAASAVLLLVLGFLTVHQEGNASVSTAYQLESAVPGADAFTYVDEEEGTTLIWFSYPVENEFADEEQTDIL